MCQSWDLNLGHLPLSTALWLVKLMLPLAGSVVLGTYGPHRLSAVAGVRGGDPCKSQGWLVLTPGLSRWDQHRAAQSQSPGRHWLGVSLHLTRSSGRTRPRSQGRLPLRQTSPTCSVNLSERSRKGHLDPEFFLAAWFLVLIQRLGRVSQMWVGLPAPPCNAVGWPWPCGGQGSPSPGAALT